MTLPLPPFEFMHQNSLLAAFLIIVFATTAFAQESKLKKIDKGLAKGDTLKTTYKLNKWIAKKPDFAPFYWERAMLKMDKGDYQPALVDLNTYSSLGGKSERADYYRAVIQMNQKNYPQALTFFKKHLEHYPSDFKAFEKMGECLLELKRFEEALSAYSSALDIKPYDSRTLYNTGLAAFYAGHLTLADSLFKTAHRAAPRDADILLAEGLNLNKMRNYKESAQVLKQLTTLSPDNARAWYNLGVNYYFLDQNQAACETWLLGSELGSLPAKQAHEKYCLSKAGQ